MHSLGEVNFLIELVGFTVDLVILGIILYAYLREKEKEKYLLFWVIAYLLLIASVFLTLVFESKIIPRLIFLKQVFSISAGVVFLWGALGLKWGEKFKHKSEFLTLITFAVFVSVLSDFIFSEKWRYIVSLLFILLFFLIAGVRVILHARTAKMPSYRLFGLSLILFGLTTVANFISAISLEFVRLSLFFEQVLLTLLGVSILVIILDKYMVRTIQVEKLYRTVVDVMNEALVLLDTKLKITYINNRFGELMKCRSFDDLIGRKFIDFIPDRFHEIVLEKEKSIEAGLCSTYEIEIKDMEKVISTV